MTGLSRGETVTFLIGADLTGGYNDTTLDWTSPARVPVTGVGVEPRPSSELATEARNAVTSGFTLYLAGQTFTPDPLNRVEVRGRTYEVDGEVAKWVNPFSGWAPGCVVQTKVVEG